MKYSLDRFKRKKKPEEIKPDGELASGLADATKLSTWGGSLGRILDKLDKKKEADKQAKKSMVTLLQAARDVGGDEEESPDVMGKLLGKLLNFIGKKIFKAIVRPILQFAARMAMNILRIAARTLLRFVVLPAIELVSTALIAVLASPIGWAAIAAAAIFGGGYYLWKNSRTPETIEVAETAATGAVVEGEASPEVAAPAEPPKTRFERAIETVREAAPVRAVERVLERPKIFVPKKGAKFQGFGDEVDGNIRETSAKYPILPEAELRGFIKMEAGWTGNMSPTGAIGAGQFTAGTWNRLIPLGGSQLGMRQITGIYGEEKDEKGKPIRPHIKPNAKGSFRTTEDPRFDRRVNTLATGLLAAGNAAMLKKAGLPVNGANLYMMHNIGPGIIAVMKGGEATDATKLAMRQNGMVGAVNTPEKFLEFQKARYASAYQEANTTTSPVSETPEMAKGVTVDKPGVAARAAAKGSAVSAPVASSNSQSTDLIKGPGNSIVRM